MNVLSSALVLAMSMSGISGPAPSTALDWHDCTDEYAAECATLTLPVDWAHPDGPTFGLAVARHRATDPADRVGTLIFGPGGPGDSGVDRVRNGLERFSADLQQHFDIVSFDPRGVGGSNPVVCSPDLVAEAPPPVLASQADLDTTLAYNRALWADCRARTGPIFDHADTASTVRDLDALRVALGEHTLTFQGSSYGTLLGEQYAERYPDRVRAIVLESVVDHHPTTTSAFLSSQSWALQDSFDVFVDWCAATTACALHGRDVRAVYAGLLARADAGDLGMAPFDLAALVFKNTKDPDYPKLAQILAGLDAGGLGQPAGSLGVVVPAFCNDWSLPVRSYQQYAAILRDAKAVAPDVRYGAQVFSLTMCLGWPHVANPQHTLQVHTARPLLLLNSRHDPATGVNWALSTERQLGRDGVLVVYQGAGHGSYTLSGCMQQTADAYLISLRVPRRGTTCR